MMMQFQAVLSPSFAIRFALGGEPVTAQVVAQAIARGLQRRFAGMRGAAKILARMVGIDHRTAEKLLCARTTVSSPNMILLMREIDEVREEVLRLAGDMTAAEAARVAAALSQIETTLQSIGRGGRAA